MSTALVRPNNDLVLAGPIGSLDAYLERVSHIPVLEREQEIELAQRFHVGQDLSAARQLVLSHLRLSYISRAGTAAMVCRLAIWCRKATSA